LHNNNQKFLPQSLAGPVLLLIGSLGLFAQTNVLVNRYDPFSQGAATNERILTPARVNSSSFGKVFSYYIDGASYAQPLYVSNVEIVGQGTHNVVYVVTMNDKVYAFDAERAGAPLWMRDLADERKGITPAPIVDVTNDNDLNIVGNAGIESTPVIDLTSQSLYLVARTKESGHHFQRLYRLDLRDGKDLTPPAIIEASVKGTAKDAAGGMVRFDPRVANQRPALALTNGTVVIAWASHEDIGPYHGWIMAYDAKDLHQTGVLCITPDTDEGGIWQSGRGPAVGENGALYFETGNGGWDGQKNFGSSVIKVTSTSNGLSVDDYFTPHNYQELNRRDTDVGSTGPLLLPAMNLLVCGDKKGDVFLLRPDHLGHLSSKDAGVVQRVPLNAGRVMAGPAFWDGPSGPTLFLWNESGVPVALRFHAGVLQPAPVLKGSVASHGSPGGALTVSADGHAGGSGIVWAVVGHSGSADHGNVPGALHAFAADSLKELWNSEQNATRDRLGTLVKFVPPLVVAGRVYVPSYDNSVQVYAPLAAASR